MSKVKIYETQVSNEIQLEVENFNHRDPAFSEINKMFNLLYAVNLDLNLSYDLLLSIKNKTKDKGAVLNCKFKCTGQKSENNEELLLLNKKKRFNTIDDVYGNPKNQPPLEIVKPFIED